MTKIVDVRDVSFSYADRQVLKDVSFTVNEGEIVTLLGPNGSGKSTLLKLIMGLIRPEDGTIRLNGSEIMSLTQKNLARQIAYVPQVHKSAFPYSVQDVVLMGRMPHKTFFFRYSCEDLDIVQAVMKRLSIVHLSLRPYTAISGGERQLVLIARALAQEARIFVMDEPASGLDYGNQMRLLEQISSLSREGYTFIKSTHSPEHALWIADRVVMLSEGRILADGGCDEIVTRETLYQLYKTRVDVVRLNGSARFCVPESISR